VSEAAASSEVSQVAAATSSQDPEVGLAAVAALRGLVEVLEALLLAVVEDTRQPTGTPKSSRRHRRIIGHVGLPDDYHGAVRPLLAGLDVDLGRLQEAVTTELRGSPR
jgi:hypothetical protein